MEINTRFLILEWLQNIQHGCHSVGFWISQLFPWQIKKFPRPISLTSSNNGLKPTHTAILSTHKFMLSACYKQWTWTDSSFRQRRNMTEFVVQFHSTILWWSNTSHVHEIIMRNNWNVRKNENKNKKYDFIHKPH